MKVFIILAICLISVLADDHVRLIGHQVHDDFPGKCYHKETKHAYAIGEVYTPVGTCEHLTCQEEFVVRSAGCPKVGVGAGAGAGCKFVAGDKNKEYPICCGKHECTDADGKVTSHQIGE